MSENSSQSPLEDYVIKQDDEGAWNATSLQRIVTVLPEGDTKIFMRNGVRPFAPGGEQRVRWLVAELDGVRVYVHGNHILVTKQDLYP